MPEPRRSAADRALDYVLNSEIELFQDQHSVAYISFENFLGRMERWGVNSKAALETVSAMPGPITLKATVRKPA